MLRNPKTGRMIKKNSWVHKQLVKEGIASKEVFKSDKEVFACETKLQALEVKERLQKNSKPNNNEYYKLDNSQKRIITCARRLTNADVMAKSSEIAISVITDINDGKLLLPDLTKKEMKAHLQKLIDQRLLDFGCQNTNIKDNVSSIPEYQILESEEEEESSEEDGESGYESDSESESD
jgi:hypothetical protein